MKRTISYTIIFSLFIILMSVMLSWIIISSKTGLIYPYAFFNANSFYNNTIITLAVLLLGIIALLITRSIVFTLLLPIHIFINIFHQENPLMGYNSYILLVYIGVTLSFIGLLRYFGREIHEPIIQYLDTHNKFEYKQILTSIGASLISFGVIGITLEDKIILLYHSFHTWIILTLLTGITIGILSPNSTMSFMLGLFSPLSPTLAVTPALTEKKESETEHEMNGIPIGVAILKLTLNYEKQGKQKIVLKEKKYKPKLRKHVLVKISPWNYPNPHIMIIGDTGSGKSRLAKIIATEKKKINEPTIILDFHGEYTELKDADYELCDPLKTWINPLDLDGDPPTTRALEYGYLLSELFELGQIQRALLIDVLREAYEAKGIYDENPETWTKKSPTLKDVLSILSERILLTEKRDEKTRLETLRRYLETISLHRIDKEELFEIEKIIHSNTVILLNKAQNPILQEILVTTLLRKILLHKQKRMETKLTIIIDEAHRLTAHKKTRELIEKIVTESRKFGVSIILVTQNPLSLTPTIISNTATRIIFRITENKSLDYISKLILPTSNVSLLEKIKTYIKTLQPNHAMLVTENILILFKTLQNTRYKEPIE